jgi:hypothetical protein
MPLGEHSNDSFSLSPAGRGNHAVCRAAPSQLQYLLYCHLRPVPQEDGTEPSTEHPEIDVCDLRIFSKDSPKILERFKSDTQQNDANLAGPLVLVPVLH